jgi:hypothetical protein
VPWPPTRSALRTPSIRPLYKLHAGFGERLRLGTTEVTCTGQRYAGNISVEKTFDVTVQDTTKPTLNLPLTSLRRPQAQRHVVNYSTSATDLVDGNR